jgi:chromosome segregation ATPase
MSTGEMGLGGHAPTVTVRPATPEELAHALDGPTVEQVQADLRATERELVKLTGTLNAMREQRDEARAQVAALQTKLGAIAAFVARTD